MDEIRVMIADDEDTVRDALVSILGTDSHITLVGAARDADDAIEVAARAKPDVALLDVRMPGGGGPRAAREILRRSPGTRIIALSALEDADSLLGMLHAGASDYVAKSQPTDEILRAIRERAKDGSRPSTTDSPEPSHVLLQEVIGRTGWAERRAERLRRICSVLENDGMTMVFQPIFDLANGSPVGAEALARFTGFSERAPSAWFTDAESIGLLVEFEIAAVRRALQAAEDMDPSVFLSVNVAPATCRSPQLHQLLARTHRARVVLEITEHHPVDDYDALVAALAPLRAGGVRLAIDDACAGFASLRHVLFLKPDLIKLDVSLTRDLETDGLRRGLVDVLAGFASNASARVVAEGIETARESEALRNLGVDYGQGFYFAPPAKLPKSGAWPAWGLAQASERIARSGRADSSVPREAGDPEPEMEA